MFKEKPYSVQNVWNDPRIWGDIVLYILALKGEYQVLVFIKLLVEIYVWEKQKRFMNKVYILHF
jgi:hypothetical protein